MPLTPSDIRIGIVDDHIQTAISISQMLEYHGFKTFQAYNSKDALVMVKEKKPELLITDLKLGESKTGYDLAKELPKQKVLFITGYELDKNKPLKNVIGTLRKPIDINELLKIVEREFKLPKLGG